MTFIESELRTFLLSDPNIFLAFDQRIHIDKIPDETICPFIKLSTVDTDTSYTQDGEGPVRRLIQIDVYDESLENGKTNCNLVKNLLSGYHGFFGVFKVGFSFVQDVRGFWDPDKRRFKQIMEVTLGFR